MRTRIALFAVAALSLGSTLTTAAQQAEPAAPNPLMVTIDTAKTAEPVSKYEFGMFIEHIGASHLSQPVVGDARRPEILFPDHLQRACCSGRAAGRRVRRNQLRKWRPVGPDEVVAMDKDQPFVGDQSPRIKLDSATPHGIRQSGFSLVKGKKYIGRIYLRGTPGSKVKVSLIWGEGASDRQTVSFGSARQRVQEVPAQLHSQGR